MYGLMQLRLMRRFPLILSFIWGSLFSTWPVIICSTCMKLVSTVSLSSPSTTSPSHQHWGARCVVITYTAIVNIKGMCWVLTCYYCIHVAVSSIPPCCMSLSVVVNIMWFHLIIPEEFVQCSVWFMMVWCSIDLWLRKLWLAQDIQILDFSITLS